MVDYSEGFDLIAAIAKAIKKDPDGVRRFTPEEAANIIHEVCDVMEWPHEIVLSKPEEEG